ncbi:hypothetical protein MHYP_G00290780, partial [Metynnis hypsauchen]
MSSPWWRTIASVLSLALKHRCSRSRAFQPQPCASSVRSIDNAVPNASMRLASTIFSVSDSLTIHKNSQELRNIYRVISTVLEAGPGIIQVLD